MEGYQEAPLPSAWPKGEARAMKRRRLSKARRGLSASFSALAILLIGSCASSTPDGCAAPPPVLGATINTAFSPLLSTLIQRSRNGAAEEGTMPLPAGLRRTLEPFFADSTLDRARWTIASDRLGLGSLITATMPRYKALTLEDTIVFRDLADTRRLDVWIHELSHVEQYERAGGTPKFARQYLASWDAMELASVRRTNGILQELGITQRQGTPSLRRACTLATAGQSSTF